MATSSEWHVLIQQWEQRMKTEINALQSTFQNERHALQLELDSNGTPFCPSSVLTQLIRRNQKQNPDRLERKLESELRQHYERESARACDQWKQLHSKCSHKQREIFEILESNYRQLSNALQAHTLKNEDFEILATSQQSSSLSNQIENQIDQFMAREWINQERFNIQEAFTNQTKRIQVDYENFMEQLDLEFAIERAKLIQQPAPSIPKGSSASRRQQQLMDRQFKSKTKRSMLMHTAPVVELHKSGRQSKLLQDRGHSSDVSHTQQQLHDLEQQYKTCKEEAENRRKEGMQAIGRQCAHMFSQLDCKEKEAKLIECLLQQTTKRVETLLIHLKLMVDSLQQAIQGQDGVLPLIPILYEVQPQKHVNVSKIHPRRRSETIMKKTS